MNQKEDELEISLPDAFRSVWEIRWIVIALIILSGIAGGIFSSTSSPSFETKASMLVTARTADGNYQNGSGMPGAEDIHLSQDLTKTVQMLAVSNRVLKEVLEKSSCDDISVEDLKSQIQVTSEDDTAFLFLTLSWSKEDQAVELLNTLMDVLPDTMLEVMDIGSVNVIDKAERAEIAGNNTRQYAGIGALAGFVFGCVLGFIYYLFAPKVRGRSSMEMLPLDVIGEVPAVAVDKNSTGGYLDEENVPVQYQESYGRLAAVFRYITEKEKRQIIAVTSSTSGEGKSTVAYNLSLKLTETGSKVLLLDFDFKKGVLYQLTKLRKPKDGDVRTEPRSGEHLDRFVERMYNGIYTIQGFAEKDIFQVENQVFPAIREMKEMFDYIIIDTTPVGVLADVQMMRGLMDGVLLVVRQDVASVNDVTDSIEFLEKAGIEIMGGILNGGKGTRHKYTRK